MTLKRGGPGRLQCQSRNLNMLSPAVPMLPAGRCDDSCKSTAKESIKNTASICLVSASLVYLSIET